MVLPVKAISRPIQVVPDFSSIPSENREQEAASHQRYLLDHDVNPIHWSFGGSSLPEVADDALGTWDMIDTTEDIYYNDDDDDEQDDGNSSEHSNNSTDNL